MELKTYTADEANYYVGATSILESLIAQCCTLHRHAISNEEKEVISAFERRYAIWRNTLEIADTESVDRVYEEVRPLIRGKLTMNDIYKNFSRQIF